MQLFAMQKHDKNKPYHNKKGWEREKEDIPAITKHAKNCSKLWTQLWCTAYFFYLTSDIFWTQTKSWFCTFYILGTECLRMGNKQLSRCNQKRNKLQLLGHCQEVWRINNFWLDEEKQLKKGIAMKAFCILKRHHL